jgi:predicted Rossmann-fold nucleotide-binding protein
MTKIKEAFKDKKFLESPEGRSIRILAEYEKVKSVFEIHKIIDTITFFGSARIKATEDSKNLTDENTQYYERARELAFKFTSWAKEYSNNLNRFVIATGGGPGIMEAANRGAFEAGGKSIGLGIKLPEEQENNKYITPGLKFTVLLFFYEKIFFSSASKSNDYISRWL